MSEKRRLKFILKFFLDEYLKIENGKVRVDKETADLIYRVIVYIISRLEKELTPEDDKLRAYLYYAKKENGELGACGVPRSVFFCCGQRLPVVAVVVTPITTLVPAAHHLPATLIPAAQHLAVEAVLSIQDVIELGG